MASISNKTYLKNVDYYILCVHILYNYRRRTIQQIKQYLSSIECHELHTIRFFIIHFCLDCRQMISIYIVAHYHASETS
jgi:hypothetical protein